MEGSRGGRGAHHARGGRGGHLRQHAYREEERRHELAAAEAEEAGDEAHQRGEKWQGDDLREEGGGEGRGRPREGSGGRRRERLGATSGKREGRGRPWKGKPRPIEGRRRFGERQSTDDLVQRTSPGRSPSVTPPLDALGAALGRRSRCAAAPPTAASGMATCAASQPSCAGAHVPPSESLCHHGKDANTDSGQRTQTDSDEGSRRTQTVSEGIRRKQTDCFRRDPKGRKEGR